MTSGALLKAGIDAGVQDPIRHLLDTVSVAQATDNCQVAAPD
jgi:hypothetical protein